MSDAEFIVIAVIIVIVFAAYFGVYPKYCGSNGYRIAAFDLLLSGMALLISGTLFWDSGESFSLLLFSVNWFVFTFVVYLLIESPIAFWYYKKHNVWDSFKQE